MIFRGRKSVKGFIDWELLAELADPPMTKKLETWDHFAEKYDGYARLEEEFTRLQIDKIAFEPQFSLLDVGAGPGRISIPAAGKVDRVTALDASLPMLDRLRKNASESGISNIDCINLPWEDVQPGENVLQHDIVIASRTAGMRDLKKLNALAKRFVYVMSFIGPSLKDFHDALMRGIDPEPKAANPRRVGMPHHVLAFNRLCDMGINPSVEYVRDGFSKWYACKSEAYEDFPWLNVPRSKEQLFRQNLDQFLSEENSGYRLLRESKTVIIWWSK